MSCRTGPLRVGRPPRGGYTGLARMIFVGPPVGRGTNGSDPLRAVSPFGRARVSGASSALLESIYSDEVPLLWFFPGPSC
jgi:hypothetical protein